MKFLKNFLIITFSVSLIGIFSGCKKEKITVLLCEGTYSYAIKSEFSQFIKENSCEIEIVEKNSQELYDEIISNASSKPGKYDLIMVDASWTESLYSQNALSNLSNLDFKFGLDFIPNSTTVCYSGNDIYLVPYFANVTVLAYNKSAIQNLGLDAKKITTLESLLEISKFAQSRGMNGFIYRGDTYSNIVNDFLPILLAHGGWVVNSHFAPTIDNEIFKASVNYYKELVSTGKAVGDKENITKNIYTGQAALTIGWPDWFMTSLLSPADYTVCPVSKSIYDFPLDTSICKTWSLGIPENSSHVKTAYSLLCYLSSSDTMKRTVIHGGLPCKYSSLTNSQTLKKHPYLETICTAVEKGVFTPCISKWNSFSEILGKEMDLILKNEKSVEQGLKDAQKELEKLMGISLEKPTEN